ncbi:MAG: YdcF family protein [Oceanicaulis sp.]
MSRAATLVRAVAFAVLVTFATGFVLYVHDARSMARDERTRADGIVALTGGEGRVRTAVTLLRDRRAGRLLISGVNPVSPPEDIARAAGAPAELFNCCIDTGEEAEDTRGNAREAASWVRRNGFSTVIVVTNDFHMPRALLELQAAMPDTRLIAYTAPTPPPWSSPGEARRWLQEYAKYAAVFVREHVGVLGAGPG